MENQLAYKENLSLAYWARKTTAHPDLASGMDRRFDVAPFGGTYYQSSVRKV